VEFRDNDVTDDEISSIMEQLSQLAGSTGDHFLFLVCFPCYYMVWFSCEATYAVLDEMLGCYGLWKKQLQLAHPQVMDRGNYFQIWRVAANILKDQSQTDDGGGVLSCLGVGQG
jgi:hypothetical protein